MSKKMLIDATHPEETRVAIINGNRLEEYDYENQLRKQLKSNIYLVKVTRVEPSLQAAFVDFGGQRHGFLPFPEIHPDYYRIPIADREALLAEERALAAREAEREDAEDEAALAAASDDDEDGDLEDLEDEVETVEPEESEAEAEEEEEPAPRRNRASLARRVAEKLGAESEDEEDADEGEMTVSAISIADAEEEIAAEEAEEGDDDAPEADAIETAETAVEDAGEEDLDEVGGGDGAPARPQRASFKRRYKIQEVIKRNQIMLIQINKEERGNKGAAVTSYISLPGRYCVLMPNSPRGGGVSRKVSNAKDRQKLKSILRELDVPEGMSVILRTAGVARTTAEIKRDLDYLLRLWDEIREFTLRSTAPQLIYEEGNLIKRAIRDLYKRDIDEVHVAGEEGYKTARDFMQMLAPANVDRVHAYNDKSIPLFYRHQVETQIDAIHSPTVHLKSGGYIVINPTEALVSIDVNSGRATKGRHIEETALKTNIEAAEEVARQLRLRDQGGLIVIDFIDMEDRRANRIVEKKLRDAMASDRARIQLGRISPFGLLELSRQRLHPSLVETNFETCKHCAGQGIVRTNDTMAVMVLRALEEEGLKGKSNEIRITVPTDVALYIFNHKRGMLAAMEERYNLRIFISADDKMLKPHFTIEGARGAREDRNAHRHRPAPVQSLTMGDMSDFADNDAVDALDDAGENEESNGEGGNSRRGRDRDRGERGRRGGRNRRGRDRDRGERNERSDRGDRRRGGRDVQDPADAPQPGYADAPETLGDDTAAHDDNGDTAETADGEDKPSRRRGRRGGRRRGGRNRGPRENGDAVNGQEGSQEGEGAAAVANDSRERRPPRERAERAERAEQAEPRQHGGDDHGGDEAQSAAGGTRKGWWKRLTE
jgi:ribonuclease E